MSEEKKTEQAPAAENKADTQAEGKARSSEQGAAGAGSKEPSSREEKRPQTGRGGGGDRRGGGGRRGGPRRGRRDREEKEFEQSMLSLDRVTRVTKGGKRMRFRAAMVIGDAKTHRVALGVSKASDVANAMNKAVRQAKKHVFTVKIEDETIPHEVSHKFRAAKVLLKPAPKGTGVKAGGAVRVVLELAGVPNVTGKILGSKNKLNNAKATLEALQKLRSVKPEEAKKDEKKEKATEKATV